MEIIIVIRTGSSSTAGHHQINSTRTRWTISSISIDSRVSKGTGTSGHSRGRAAGPVATVCTQPPEDSVLTTRLPHRSMLLVVGRALSSLRTTMTLSRPTLSLRSWGASLKRFVQSEATYQEVCSCSFLIKTSFLKTQQNSLICFY